MELTFSPDQIIYAIIGIASPIGAVAYGLKKKGLITFGKPKERRMCSQVCMSHDELSKDVKKLDVKLDLVSGDLSEIKGFLKGRNGF